jgi:hypothetical protein
MYLAEDEHTKVAEMLKNDIFPQNIDFAVE